MVRDAQVCDQASWQKRQRVLRGGEEDACERGIAQQKCASRSAKRYSPRQILNRNRKGYVWTFASAFGAQIAASTCATTIAAISISATPRVPENTAVVSDFRTTQPAQNTRTGVTFSSTIAEQSPPVDNGGRAIPGEGSGRKPCVQSG